MQLQSTHTLGGAVAIASCCDEAVSVPGLSNPRCPFPLNNATWGPAYAHGDADAIPAGAARGPGPHVVAGWRRPRPRGGRAGPVGESERGREIGHLLEKQRAEGGPRELGARGHPPPRRRRARTETEAVRDRERRARAACLPVCRPSSWPPDRSRSVLIRPLSEGDQRGAGPFRAVRGRNTWPWPAPIGIAQPARGRSGQGQPARRKLLTGSHTAL